jgi:hypothetical protein
LDADRDEDDMALTLIHRTALAVSLTAILFGSNPLLGQEAPGTLALARTRISIAGTSNVHEYTASTTMALLLRLQLAAGVAPTLQAPVAPGAIEAFEIAIPAATLSSEKASATRSSSWGAPCRHSARARAHQTPRGRGTSRKGSPASAEPIAQAGQRRHDNAASSGNRPFHLPC